MEWRYGAMEAMRALAVAWQWQRCSRATDEVARPHHRGWRISDHGREREREGGIDAGEADRGAVAREQLIGVQGGRAAPDDCQVHQADRLARRGAARPRDAGHRDGEIDAGVGQRTFGHGAGDVLTDRADSFEQRRRHAEHLRLGAVVVGDVAALDHGRGARDLGQAGDDQAAGAGLRGREVPAAVLACGEQAAPQIEARLRKGHGSQGTISHNAPPAYAPATTSSSITPKPPVTARSMKLAGQGLSTSRTRNSTKPSAYTSGSSGKRA